MSELIVLPDHTRTPRVFYIQRWDNKGFTIAARSYFRTESSYIFTTLTYEELRTHWHRGTLQEVPPILEMDADSVLMIVDQEYYEATTPPQTPTKSRAKKKPAAKKTRNTKKST